MSTLATSKPSEHKFYSGCPWYG